MKGALGINIFFQILLVDPFCRQPSPMSNASWMLRILGLDSLARLTIVSGKV